MILAKAYKRALLLTGVLFLVFTGQAQQDYDYATKPQSADEDLIAFEKQRYTFNLGIQLFFPSVKYEKLPTWNNYSRTTLPPLLISADYIFSNYLSAGIYGTQRLTAISFRDSMNLYNEYDYYELEVGGRINCHFLSFFYNRFSNSFLRRRFDAYLSVGYSGYMVLEFATRGSDLLRADADFGLRPVGLIGARFALAEYVGVYMEGIYGKMGYLGLGLTFGFASKS